MKLRILTLSAVALVAASLLWAGVDLTNAKCPVGGHKALDSMSAEYKGGKVYFCCDGCPQAFEKDPAKFATLANQQLFATGQAKQIACPLSGSKVVAGETAKVDGSTVGFCCPSCKDAVEQAEDKKKVELVFADEAFDKGFKVGD